MPLTYKFTNNATSRLREACAASDNILLVSTGEGARFPQGMALDEGFTVTIEDRRTGQMEICLCTGVIADVLQVVRGYEGTTPQAFAYGATVSNRLTAGTLDAFQDMFTGGGSYAPSTIDEYFRRRFPTFASIGSATLGSAITRIVTDGYYAAGDGGGAAFVFSNTEPLAGPRIQTANGRWFGIDPAQTLDVRMFGVRMGLAGATFGVANSTAMNDAMYFANVYKVASPLFVPADTFYVGDAATPNTCLRARSRVTVLHAPGVEYIHRALGRTAPLSTHQQSANLAAQACLLQIDGCEFGAIEKFHWLGKPTINGEGSSPAERGVEMLGEINDSVVEVVGTNISDFTVVWADDIDFRYSKGKRNKFSISYWGPVPTPNAYAVVNFFTKWQQADGMPGVEDIEFYDCNIDCTGGVTSVDTGHATECIKINGVNGVHFRNVSLMGGRVACLNLTNGTINVTGSVNVGGSLVGVSVTDAANNISPAPTGNINLIVNMKSTIGANRGQAAVVQGSTPNVLLQLQSSAGGAEVRTSDFIRFAVSGLSIAPGATVTISAANPAVVSWTGHGLSVGCPVKFTTTGALPYPLVASRFYYVHTVVNPNSFTLTTYPGSTQISTFGSAQSGVHTSGHGLAHGDTITTSGGATGVIQGFSTGFVTITRLGLTGTFVPTHTFTTTNSKVSGTIGAITDPDALFGLKIIGTIRAGYFALKPPTQPLGIAARAPVRGAHIDLAIDGLDNTGAFHNTIAQCDTGSATWWCEDGYFKLNFINPPTHCMSGYGKSNKYDITSDGVGSFVSGSTIFRDFGQNNTLLNVACSRAGSLGKHSTLFSRQSGSQRLTVEKAVGYNGLLWDAATAAQDVTFGKRTLRADFVLSDAVTSKVIQVSNNRYTFVTGVEVVYPDGTTADAGVTLSVGSLASPANLFSTTTPVSAVAGRIDAFGQTGTPASAQLLAQPLASGSLVVRTGGKTGADRAVVFIHVVDLYLPA